MIKADMRPFAIFRFVVIAFLNLPLYVVSGQTGGASELYETIVQYEEDMRALERKYTLVYTQEYFDRFTRFYQEWGQHLSQKNFEELSRQGQADYVLLANHMAKGEYSLQTDFAKTQLVSHLFTCFDPLYAFVRDRRNGQVPEYEKIARVFEQTTLELSHLSDPVVSKPLENWLLADRARMVVESLRDNLREAYRFYHGYDPQFTWWMEQPYQQLDLALERYANFVAKNYSATTLPDDGSGIIGKPIGRAAIQNGLQFAFIPYTPEELIAAAEAQFKYCENEMLKASEELGFGKDWKRALEYVKDTYVPPGQQPALIDSLAWDAIDFLESGDLITIPDLAKETWRMIMMTPERQRVNPFFTGGEVISISYPTNAMRNDEKMMSMRGNNPNFSSATVHHELIPGHHLQQYMTARYKPYRQLFATPFWGEGWALYWEINLWNKGFADTPEKRIGMLFWRMHRCARIIFSLSYHLGKMTPQQCIDMLVNRVGHEYANAEAEVRRSFVGGYDPLYQIAYMVGGLQFFALQKELLSEGWTEKQYHDAVLREGSIPIEILRAVLKNESLQVPVQTKWRFSTGFK